MRYAKKTFSLVIVLILAACSHQPDARDSHGNPVNLKNYLGKWVIVNYWASWCKPCLDEMPALNQIYQTHKKQVIVIGASYEHLSNQQMQNFAAKLKIQYPLVKHLTLTKYGVEHVPVLPISYIINPQGKLVKILRGSQSAKQFIQAIGLLPTEPAQ